MRDRNGFYDIESRAKRRFSRPQQRFKISRAHPRISYISAQSADDGRCLGVLERDLVKTARIHRVQSGCRPQVRV